MTWPTITIKNWAQITEFFDALGVHKKGDLVWFFRGQADSNWGLKPSILRRFENTGLSKGKALGIEFSAFRRFESQAHLYLKEIKIKIDQKQTIAWWMMMQHHSCPTRLLDWTQSPFVATYFAVQQCQDVDGSLWFFHAPKLDTLMSEKYGKLNELSPEIFLEDRNVDAVYPVFGAQHSKRSVSQQGVFTVSTNVLNDHGEIIELVFRQLPNNPWGKIIIPSELKCEFLARLHSMNITSSSLFPSIDGVGRAIEEHVLLRIWRNLQKTEE